MVCAPLESPVTTAQGKLTPRERYAPKTGRCLHKKSMGTLCRSPILVVYNMLLASPYMPRRSR